MLNYINCNLCGSSETKVIFKQTPSNIVQCKSCGLVYKNPRFFEEKILETIRYDKVEIGHKKEVWYDSKLKLFNANLKRIEKYSPKGKLLDVGCGYGVFLKMAKDNGWDVSGVEISSSACNYARKEYGLDKICQEPLRNIKFPENHFDVITLWDVIGLFFDPLAEMVEAKRILKKGGLVAIRVHNVNFHIFAENILGKLGNFGKKLNIKPTIFHFNNFSPKTIVKLLKKAGFKDIVITISPSTSGDPYATGGVLGSIGVKAIKTFIFLFSQVVYYLTFKRVFMSPAVLIFAKSSLE